MEVQSYLFVFNLATFGASFALLWALLVFFLFSFLFGPMGLFWGSRSGSKTLLEPTNVDDQFLFWKYSPIFLFSIRPNFWPFWALRGYFLARWGYFWGQDQVLKQFWNLLMQTINFCFGSKALSFCFSFDQILGLFALFGLFGAIFGVGVRFKNFFGTCLHRLTTFILEV